MTETSEPKRTIKKAHYIESPESAEDDRDPKGRFTSADLVNWDEDKHREPLLEHFASEADYHLWKSTRYRAQARAFNARADASYARYERCERYAELPPEEREAAEEVDRLQDALDAAGRKLKAIQGRRG